MVRSTIANCKVPTCVGHVYRSMERILKLREEAISEFKSACDGARQSIHHFQVSCDVATTLSSEGPTESPV